MRAHVGAGAVYLREWVNIDLPLPHVFLAKERPDLVEQFITTEDAYYARHADKTHDALRGGAVTKETACDIYGSFDFLPFRPGTVERILSVQVFEHLDRQEARRAIDNCFNVLQKGGKLLLDIPDADETLREYRKSGDEFFIRHLFGPRRSVYGFHTHYTREMLRSLVEECRFKFIRELTNIHHYPAIAMEWEKF